MTKVLLLLLPIFLSGVSFALPFNTLDARAQALGGASVASTRSTSASLFNPALLAISEKRKGYAVLLPDISAQGVFKWSHYQQLKDFEEKRFGSRLAIATAGLNALDAHFSEHRRVFLGNAAALEKRIRGLKDTRLTGMISPFRAAFARSDDVFGFSLYASRSRFTEISAGMSACDRQLLKSYAEVLNEIDGAAPGFMELKEVQLACDERVESLAIIDPARQGDRVQNIFSEDYGVKTLVSRVFLTQMDVTEWGVSFASQVPVAGVTLALGVTPKMQQIRHSFSYPLVRSLVTGKESMLRLLEQQKLKTAFNMDLGLALAVGNDALRLGVMLRDILKTDVRNSTYEPFDEVRIQHQFDLDTQIRVGASLRYEDFLFLADMDVSPNPPLYSGDKMQYISVGVEYDLFRGGLKLRGGVKNNVQNNADLSFSGGLGVNIKPLHIDIYGQAGYKNLGAGMQIGLDF